MSFRLSKLDLYVLRQIVIAALVITLSLSFIIWITQSLKLVDFIVNRGIPVSTFLYLVVLTLPNLLPVILPLTTFAAILFVFYRLSTDSELVVMHSGGVSAGQISRSPLLMAIAVTAATYILTLYLTPLSYSEFKNLQFRLRNDYSMTLLEEGVFTQISKGITVFIRERHSDGSLGGILVHDNRNPDKPMTILADRGTVSMQQGSPVIAVTRGSRQIVDKRNNNVTMLYFDSYTLNLNQIMQQENDRRAADPREMSLMELFYPPPDLNNRAQIRYSALAHQRLISPLSIICFAFIALASFRNCTTRRNSLGLRLISTIGIVLVLQAAMLTLYNALGVFDGAARSALLILSYGLPVGICGFCAYLLQMSGGKSRGDEPVEMDAVA